MTVQSIDWRPEDPAVLANPYPIFQRMRDEAPCYWSDRLRSWVITRYNDVKAMCLDKERLSSDRLRPFLKVYRDLKPHAYRRLFAIYPYGWSSRIRPNIRD